MRFLVLLAFAIGSVAARPVSVHWNDTPDFFAGKIVRVELTDGTRVEGAWTRVTPEACTFVAETPKGRDNGLRTLSRNSIRNVFVRRTRVRGRVIGTLTGFFVPGLIARAASSSGDADPIGAGLVLAGSVAGYFIGSHYDHHATERVIIVDL